MPHLTRTALITIVASVFAAGAAAIDWPVINDSLYKPIGNNYGQYQCYGAYCDGYLHNGIDIMAPPGTPVYAVKSGYVKAILTTSAESHWRVAIGDSAGTADCDAWLYAHVDEISIAVSLGQWVEAGEYLGDVVYFPSYNFHHLHFSKIRYGGTDMEWNADWSEWLTVGNPLDELTGLDDPDAPLFENAIDEQLLAFRRVGQFGYFDPGAPLHGDVDIVCRVSDYINDYAHRVAPYAVEYRIDGDSSIPWRPGFCLTGLFGTYSDMNYLPAVIYQEDAICPSQGDYVDREFYFNLTNSDGDSLIELSDMAYSWPTAEFHNGEYAIGVRAHDRAGNVTVDSMTVSVENHFPLSGIVHLADVVPQPPDGIVVTILPDGQTGTTGGTGAFAFAGVGGGSQLIEISRPGFASGDTVLVMNQERVLEMTLVPGGYLAGDANCDGATDVGDVVSIINYVFKNGSTPIPYDAGDANSDGTVNVADAVYLVFYIFKKGPPPLAD